MDVGVDAPIDRVLGDRVDEGRAGLVQFARLDDGLGQRMGVGGEEVLGEGRSPTLGGTGIGDAQMVEDFGHGRRCPDVDVHAGLVPHPLKQARLL